MAVDKTEKSFQMCLSLAEVAKRIMIAVRELDALRQEKENAGLDFSTAALTARLEAEGSPLRHASGDSFNSVLSTAVSLKAWLESTFNDDVLDGAAAL